MKKHIIRILTILLITSSLYAKENVPGSFRKSEPVMKLASGCQPASAVSTLDINNTRARIMNGGDMWWDLVGNAAYEIPKITQEGEQRKTSLFAGALWIGGYDQGNNLREAAMTYRQNGNDFFPGPLDINTASIDATVCVKWDKIFQITREEINTFIETGVASTNIDQWPGNGDPGQSPILAPFVDIDKDGIYTPNSGDYPDVLGDQTLWFVYNDKGNTHTETGAQAIGLEIQTQAFAFATNDEINNMTFYQQKIINRSKNKLTKVYFGQWVDADLGYAYDDYVACDTTRSLGICYNGDDFDEGSMGYGSNPPSVGVDFFQGPLADNNDAIDNDKDGLTDEEGEEIIMSKFVYYDNDFSLKGNPSDYIHYYYYLDGKFKNGQKMRYGGDGFNQVWDATRYVNYMFPGNPKKPKPEWSEVSSGNTPGDRRFLQSAGTFTLQPGAVNYVTVGVVWARATTGGNTGSYDLLIIADDKAQKLYNNQFKLIDGPNAPDVIVQELDRQIILSFDNTSGIERYRDSIKNESGQYISYKFQGYQVFQLKDATVTSAELDNPDKARLIARCDIKDGVTQLVNRQFVPGLGIVPTEKVDVNGDNGVKHTFSITSDAFSSGDARLVNFKAYYYMVLSYSNTSNTLEFEQYLAGRKNIQVYTAIPHGNEIEFNGTQLNSKYGDGPVFIRKEGTGNGGQTLELTKETIAKILDVKNPDDYKTIDLEYEPGNGPLNIYVYDPLKVPNASFEVRFVDSSIIKNTTYPGDYTNLTKSKNTYWIIHKATPPVEDDVIADTMYGVDNEQIIPQWGISVKIDKVVGPTSDTITSDGGFIEASLTFTDPSKRWMQLMADSDPSANLDFPWAYNWIRSGRYTSTSIDYSIHDAIIESSANKQEMDPGSIYEKVLNGTLAPYGLVARDAVGKNGTSAAGIKDFGPAYKFSQHADNKLDNVASIDLVFTSDKSKWTKCVVIEMGDDSILNEGKAHKHFLREHYSWSDYNAVDANGNPIYNTNEMGRSWFPGYAINVETGERLNIIFSEDSYFSKANGRDMIWNPYNEVVNPAANDREIDRYIWGGKHWIYIMNSVGQPVQQVGGFPYYTAYDGGDKYMQFFNVNSTLTFQSLKQKNFMRSFYSAAIWVALPWYGNNLLSLQNGLIPTETKIRIRVQKPYATYKTNAVSQNNNLPMYIFKTSNLAMTNSSELGTNALDKINIVPNPYYAFSEYEKNQLDNRIRIINLPKKCEISIYTLSGSLVRKLKKDETDDTHQTYIDWDMKNQAGIPVASGLYIVYINAFELGNKTLKWFGIMRPIDLDTF